MTQPNASGLSRTERQAQVFQPSWNQPTMSLQEYAEMEMKMAEEREERGRAAERKRKEKEENETEEERDEREAMEKRKWDNWKDDNPKGSGNKMVNTA